MTEEQSAQLAEVNAAGNAIPFIEESGVTEPPDWWTDQPMAGNSFVCRDYTQWKANRLKELGWLASALTVVLCWVEDPPGGYHAVLAVETGDDVPTILDNRLLQPYRMDQPPLPYRWDRRQVAGSVEFEAIG